MQQELKLLNSQNALQRVEHIAEYVFDILHEGDVPENHLACKLPKIWNVYLIKYMDNQVQNGGFRQFLWNTQEVYNKTLIKSLQEIGAQEYVDCFKRILERFNENPEEKRYFLKNHFSDENSSNLKNALRKITWSFLDEIEQNKSSKNIQARLDLYIQDNIEDIASELDLIGVIRGELISYLQNEDRLKQTQTNIPTLDSFFKKALTAIRLEDFNTIEGLRDEICLEHIPMLVDTWDSSLSWEIKSAYIHLFMDYSGEIFRPIMEDALNSPFPDMRADGLCTLMITQGNWSYEKCWDLRSSQAEIDTAIAEYLSKSQPEEQSYWLKEL